MTYIPEVKVRQYRTIYEILFENPRTFKNKIANLLQVKRDTASNRIREAFEQVWLSKPQIRRRSYANLKEYVYFLRCKNPTEFFSEFVEDENIIYHAATGGSANLWVVSRKKLDFECDTIVGGLRSDYHISYAPDHSWETAIQSMRKMVEEFNPKDYSPEGIIKIHWNEVVARL